MQYILQQILSLEASHKSHSRRMSGMTLKASDQKTMSLNNGKKKQRV